MSRDLRHSLRAEPPLCPSAPATGDAVIIGVVGGTASEVRVLPLVHPVRMTPELRAAAEPVAPTEVYRFAAPCLASGCRHFARATCTLATKIVRMLPAVTDDLPHCEIRPQCRWYQQEAAAACHRCPQIATHDAAAPAALREAADPTVPPHAAAHR